MRYIMRYLNEVHSCIKYNNSAKNIRIFLIFNLLFLYQNSDKVLNRHISEFISIHSTRCFSIVCNALFLSGRYFYNLH